MKALLIAAGMLVLLSGCASDAKFECGYPEGVGCKSVEQVYNMSVDGTLPNTSAVPEGKADSVGYQIKKPNNRPSETAHGGNWTVENYPFLAKPGDPIRRPARRLRIWITPWKDAAGDFHDQSYVYVVLDQGDWLLYQNRKQFLSTKDKSLDGL